MPRRMIGSDTSLIEFEFFTMVYALTVMQELKREGLLLVDHLPGVIYSITVDALLELNKKYPLPSYDILAEYAYKILLTHNPFLSFAEEDLRILFLTVQVNNGYIL